MKKLTAILLAMLLTGGTLMSCNKTETQDKTTKNETTKKETTSKGTVETKPVEAEPIEIEPGKEYNLMTLHGTTLIKGPMNFTTGSLENLCDGTMATYADYTVEGGENYSVGIKLDAPAVLTNVQMWAPDYEDDGIPNRPHVLYGMIVEGSNDGENWEFILQLGDNYTEYEEYAWDLEDGIADYFDEIPYDGESEEDDDAQTPAAYTYYRIYNDCKGAAIWGDIALWGTFGNTENESSPQ